MFTSLVFLASALLGLAAAWPAVTYSDINCTNTVKAYSDIPQNVCVNMSGVQSYQGSLACSAQGMVDVSLFNILYNNCFGYQNCNCSGLLRNVKTQNVNHWLLSKVPLKNVSLSIRWIPALSFK